jgi:hypothetical protein
LRDVQRIRRVSRLSVAVAHDVEASLGEDCRDLYQCFVDALFDRGVGLESAKFKWNIQEGVELLA